MRLRVNGQIRQDMLVDGDITPSRPCRPCRRFRGSSVWTRAIFVLNGHPGRDGDQRTAEACAGRLLAAAR